MCHTYVHADADIAMACNIILNAKAQRPGVCNSLETLIIHKNILKKLGEELLPRIAEAKVELLCDPASLSVFSEIRLRADPDCATASVHLSPIYANSFDTEYLALKLNVRTVDTIEDAIAHIQKHSSKHSEAIVCQSESIATLFKNQIDTAVTYWNASTRFTDGYELGLGGEIGISTQKLHARGPIGLRELTSVRWIIDGKGHIRK